MSALVGKADIENGFGAEFCNGLGHKRASGRDEKP